MRIFSNLYVIIVNWNLKDDTLDCITSVLKAGVVTERIILVDNASTDGSVEAIRKQFPALKIIQAETNLGFAGGTNLGIRYALAQQADWVFLLNNDTIVAPDMFSALARAVKNEPEYGIVAPLIFYSDAPEIIWSAGDRLIPGTLATRHLYHGKEKPVNLPSLIPVDFVTGCAMLIKSEVLQRIGLFDTSLFMYGEEVDLVWRARLAGYPTGCATQAHMQHKVARSANRDRPLARYRRIRNQIIFYRKYARKLQLPIMFGLVLLRVIGLGLKDIGSKQTELLAPLIRGWRDGWVSEIAQ